MSAVVMNGKDLAFELRQQMKEDILQNKLHSTPNLTVILVGNNPASKAYVKGKKKAALEVGMTSNIIELEASTAEQALLKEIEQLNQSSKVHGILVQLPLPEHINEQTILEAISPFKDVDCFHPINVGRMVTGHPQFLPCTPAGIITMIKAKSIPIEGKHAVVSGRSNIVGKPVGQLLLNENATVTYCHSKTKNVHEITKQADILVVAVGKPNSIQKEHIKPGAVVIDVGINRMDDGSLTGDVDFESAKSVASYITPVPKGVGPLTVAMLLQNTITAWKGLS